VRTKRRQAGDRWQLGGPRKVADLVLIVRAVDRRSKLFEIDVVRYPRLERIIALAITRNVRRISERDIAAQGA
jgi:hypothetical protein